MTAGGKQLTTVYPGGANGATNAADVAQYFLIATTATDTSRQFAAVSIDRAAILYILQAAHTNAAVTGTAPDTSTTFTASGSHRAAKDGEFACYLILVIAIIDIEYMARADTWAMLGALHVDNSTMHLKVTHVSIPLSSDAGPASLVGCDCHPPFIFTTRL
ncbi:MAG: hypothetical protein IKI83_00080 [Prevotella sp.]|nr:hypothetical protein [Prevotella sp.]